MSMQDILKQAMERAMATPAQPIQPARTQPNEQNDVAVIEPPVTTSQPAPTPAMPKLKTMADTHMLVRLSRGVYSPYVLDKAASAEYGAGNVNKHLFKGATNRVKAANGRSTALGQFVHSWTAPWVDEGYRTLRSDLYLTPFTPGYRQRKAELDQAVDDLLNHWDSEVQQDLDRLHKIALANQAKTGTYVELAVPSDYPTADQLATKYYANITMLPIPSAKAFPIPLTQEDEDRFAKALADAETVGRKSVIERMLDPMQAAVKRLVEYQGNKGERFHDSTILNIVETAERLAQLNDDPEIGQRIRALQSIVGQYASPTGIEALKRSSTVRQTAHQQITTIMQDMAGLV